MIKTDYKHLAKRGPTTALPAVVRSQTEAQRQRMACLVWRARIDLAELQRDSATARRESERLQLWAARLKGK